MVFTPKPINWDKLADPLAVAGFGEVYFANDEKYYGIKLLVDGRLNALSWKENPLWMKAITKTDPKYKFDGEFLKKHNSVENEPFFFDLDPDYTGVVQLGRKDTKEKVFFHIKDREITIIDSSEVTDLL